AGRDERARAFHLDDADTAGVDRGERFAVAERRRLDADLLAGLHDRRALGHRDALAVNRQLDGAVRVQRELVDCRSYCHVVALLPLNRCSLWMADCTAIGAVWPRPQIEASRITCATSSISRISSSTEPSGRPATSRWRASCWRTVPTRQGTHWPQDSSRKKAAIRRMMSVMSTESSKGMMTA